MAFHEDRVDREHLDDAEDDPELEAMKKRVQEMEAEAEKLKEFHERNAQSVAGVNPPSSSGIGGDVDNEMEEDKEGIDARSVYVGNVDYQSSPEELQAHFAPCGAINRITILCDKWTGHPKGFAYIEFSDPSLVDQAVLLNDSMFRGRVLKVIPKRTNIPGYNRGRGGRGRGRGRPRSRPRGRGAWRGW